MFAQHAGRRSVLGNQGGQVALATVAQHPAAGALRDGGQLREQAQLQLGRDLVVQRVDLVPDRLQRKHLTRQRVGADHLGRRARCLVGQEVDEGRAHPVDHSVGHEGGDDLALERVLRNGVRMALAQHRGEIHLENTREKRIVGQAARAQLVEQVHLGVGHEHGILGTGQTLAFALAFGQFLVGGQELDGALEQADVFEPAHQVLLSIEQVHGPGGGQLDLLRLVVVVLQHEESHLVGHARQQVVAALQREAAGFLHGAQQDLDVDLVIGAVHAGRVVDGVGVDQAAGLGEFDAAVLRAAEVAAFAEHLAAQLVAVDAEGVARLVAHLDVALVAGLHISADAAVVEQVHRRLEDGVEQLVGRHGGGLGADDGARLRAQGNGLGAARENATALADEALVVVVPAGARQFEQALALGKAGRNVGARVDEDVTVVERQHQLDLAGQQHAVAEHIARHVADAGHCEGLGLCVHAQAAEVALDRLPRAARGDAHLLVVVAHRAAGGERVAQPEAVGRAHAVGDVAEGGRALVGGDHQVGVVLVVSHHIGWRHHRTLDHVVGDIQQAGQEGLVAGHAFGKKSLALAGKRGLLEHEAALGAHRHNHRVLHHLRLHQAQDLGAEIFAPVGPAQATARDLAATQVHTLDARGVHPDLEQGFGFGHVGDVARAELEAHALFAALVGVGAQRGLDGAQELAQHTVFFQTGHVGQSGFQRLHLGADALGARIRLRRVEADGEQLGQALRDRGVLVECFFDVALAEREAQLLEVTHVGAQHGNGAGIEFGGEHQAVERIALHLLTPDRVEQFFEAELEAIHVQRLGKLQAPVVDPVAGCSEVVRMLVEDASPHGLHHRHGVRQGDLLRGVGLQAHLPLTLVELEREGVLFAQSAEHGGVTGGGVGVEMLAVSGGERGHHRLQPAGVATAVGEQHGVHTVHPALAGLGHTGFELDQIDLRGQLVVGAHDVVDARERAVGEHGGELDRRRVEDLGEDRPELHPQLGGVHIARHINQQRRQAAEGAAAHEETHTLALLQAQDAHGVLLQRGGVDLQHLVARVGLQDGLQGLVRMAARDHAGMGHHLCHMLAHHRDLLDRRGIRRRGIQAHETAFAHQLAAGVQALDADDIQPGRAVHGGAAHRLGGQHQTGVGHKLLCGLGRQNLGARGLEQAQRRARHRHQHLALELVVFGGQKGEVALFEPGQEGLGFVGHRGVQRGEAGVEHLHAREHGAPVLHGQADILQGVLNGFAQRKRLGVGGKPVALDQDARDHLPLASAGLCSADDLHDMAGRVARDAQQGMDDPVQGAPASVDRHAHRVHQKRQVGVHDLQHVRAALGCLLPGQVQDLNAHLARCRGAQQGLVGSGHGLQQGGVATAQLLGIGGGKVQFLETRVHGRHPVKQRVGRLSAILGLPRRAKLPQTRIAWPHAMASCDKRMMRLRA